LPVIVRSVVVENHRMTFVDWQEPVGDVHPASSVPPQPIAAQAQQASTGAAAMERGNRVTARRSPSGGGRGGLLQPPGKQSLDAGQRAHCPGRRDGNLLLRPGPQSSCPRPSSALTRKASRSSASLPAGNRPSCLAIAASAELKFAPRQRRACRLEHAQLGVVSVAARAALRQRPGTDAVLPRGGPSLPSRGRRAAALLEGLLAPRVSRLRRGSSQWRRRRVERGRSRRWFPADLTDRGQAAAVTMPALTAASQRRPRALGKIQPCERLAPAAASALWARASTRLRLCSD
jgi:hypothetical protein